MLQNIAETFGHLFGPLRLFSSHLFLASFAGAFCAAAAFWVLPRCWNRLPRDQGRAHAIGAQGSIGKPMGAGVLFVPLLAVVTLLVVPLEWPYLTVVACMLLSMIVGYFDDRKQGGFGEYTLGAFDLVVSLVAALAVCQWVSVDIWLPFVKNPISTDPWLFVSLGTVLVWGTINSTNATDGVDGLSGSLSTVALVFLGVILYAVVGHEPIAAYLLVPHYTAAANWSLMAFTMVGCLAAYLWYNASPSLVLMGDAGSRPVGLLLGVLVLASGNPFLIFVVAGVVLVNGGTGLLKVALKRFFGIPTFRNIRYPLHDHVRERLGWSNTQVLVRFMLLQVVGAALLLAMLLKLR